MTPFERIEASRVARNGIDPTHARHRAAPRDQAPTVKFNRTDYAVAKVYDDAERKPVVVKTNLSAHEAEAHAGKWRDAMSERDVELAMAEGWNYAVVTVRGSHPKAKRQPFIPGRAR